MLPTEPSSAQKPRLAFVSHVLPYPGSAGQQQRVRYLLAALRTHFHVDFITSDRIAHDNRQLLQHADDVVLLHSPRATRSRRVLWAISGALFVAATGLKRSNYSISRIDLPSRRLASIASEGRYSVAVFQYWHAWAGARHFREAGAYSVLDMHDVLWRARDAQLTARAWPRWLRAILVKRYQKREERAWLAYDALIAINREEEHYARETAPGRPVLYGPMGLDLALWPRRWSRPEQPTVLFYGGLGSARGERDALWAYHRVMTYVWEALPDATFVVAGSNPGPRILALASDARVRVLGFVRDIGQVIGSASVVVCPFEGQYGFRSRLIEVLATGTPLIASSDAIYGMGLDEEHGVLVRDDSSAMAGAVIELIKDGSLASELSARGRRTVEGQFSVEDSYHRLVKELCVSERHAAAVAIRRHGVTPARPTTGATAG